jgi:MFS family permease
MLGIVYYPGVGSMPTTSDTAIKLATSAGTVIGQLFFGAMADIVGRKKMYGLELIVIIFSTLAQALASSSPSMDIVGLIIFWRVLMVSFAEHPTPMTSQTADIVIRVSVSEATIHYPASSRPNSRLRNGAEP